MKVKITATIIGIFALAFVFSSCEKDDDELNVVDLGLPSGNLWATCNVGASNPWGYGNYYAWGETETKSVFGYTTYKYWDSSNKTYTKYLNASSSLEALDDVATILFGSAYSIPTIADWDELANECCWIWTYDYDGQGIAGYIIYKAKLDEDKGVCPDIRSKSYSLSDVHIFLPAAGRKLYNGPDDKPDDEGRKGCYWSNSLYNNSEAYGCLFVVGTVYTYTNIYYRPSGNTIRPIRRTK